MLPHVAQPSAVIVSSTVAQCPYHENVTDKFVHATYFLWSMIVIMLPQVPR